MKKPKIYLDLCCCNRPFDDQAQPRIQFETVAKLGVQKLIAEEQFEFVWSYILDYENLKNPFIGIKNAVIRFAKYADEIVIPSESIMIEARKLQSMGLKKFDSLHVACAKQARCHFFLTVDDKLLKKKVDGIDIADPIHFLNSWLKGELQ